MNQDDTVYAFDFEGERYDVGEKIGFVKTTIQFAINNDEMSEEIIDFLQTLKKMNWSEKIQDRSNKYYD